MDNKRYEDYVFHFILWRHNKKFLPSLFLKPLNVVVADSIKPARKQEAEKFPKKIRSLSIQMKIEVSQQITPALIKHRRKRNQKRRGQNRGSPKRMIKNKNLIYIFSFYNLVYLNCCIICNFCKFLFLTFWIRAFNTCVKSYKGINQL